MGINNDHKGTILVVDDDPNVLEVLDARLTSAGYHVIKASGASEAIAAVAKRPADLMISDMRMPEMDGMALFKKIRLAHPRLPVIFLTAYSSIPDAVTAVKAGAIDYIAKPFDGRELLLRLERILAQSTSLNDGDDDQLDWDEDEQVQSPVMQDLFKLIDRVAASDVNVLIFGESGVGKERIARRIHQLSSRHQKPFVVVDCGATPTGLLESELFGHIKGSFTHAISDKKGLVETADGGTLFLDEVGNISPEMQLRLLRFLENHKFRRIGDVTEVAVDCRIIAATNSDLEIDIQAGRFREDLYYRLKVVAFTVPPLCARKDDIPALAEHFVAAFAKKHGQKTITLSPASIDQLCRYRWPGNVRELKNALEAGVVLCRDGVLRPEDLQLPEEGLQDSPECRENGLFSLEESERQTIERALEHAGGIQKEAAKLLGISRRAIHYKIKKYHINAAQFRANARRRS